MFFILLAGSALLILLLIVGFFYRIGKPVNIVLSDAYYHHAWKKKIVHSPMGNWFELGYHETDADPESFVVLARDYGKDHQSVYWKGQKQPVDYSTFHIDKENIPKDAQHVYFDQHYQDNLQVVIGADPQTYHLYKEGSAAFYQFWCQDVNAYYIAGQKINVDRKTFVRINATIAIDTNFVYAVLSKNDKTVVSEKLKRPAGEALAISQDYARIGNMILLSDWKNEFAVINFDHIDSIRLLNERTLVVNGQLIRDGLLLPGADVATWQELGRDHFKDKTNVYFDGKPIETADPSTFELIFEAYSKDHQHVFYEDRILTGANPATFVYQYNTGVATDGTLSFKDGIAL